MRSIVAALAAGLASLTLSGCVDEGAYSGPSRYPVAQREYRRYDDYDRFDRYDRYDPPPRYERYDPPPRYVAPPRYERYRVSDYDRRPVYGRPAYDRPPYRQPNVEPPPIERGGYDRDGDYGRGRQPDRGERVDRDRRRVARSRDEGPRP